MKPGQVTNPLFLLLAVLCLFITNCTGKPTAVAPTPDPLVELKDIIENIPDATAFRYGAVDSAGNSMDTAKIIADPEGGYLAVYHTYDPVNRYFQVHLATSNDLLTWTYQQSYGAATHQPSIQAVDGGGFILANETDDGHTNWLMVRFYASRTDLLANNVTRTFNVPHTLVPEGKWAEGTPNILSAVLDPDIDHSTIQIGFHYYKSGAVDRQALGVLENFTTWKSQALTPIDDAIKALGVGGNIGDRDLITFNNRVFMLIEGQLKSGDFGSWKVFLWDVESQTATQLNIRTHGGSQSTANPTLTLLPAPDGGEALVVTLYIPSENSAEGEAGELIYYRKLE